jgi:hypothetical protein
VYLQAIYRNAAAQVVSPPFAVTINPVLLAKMTSGVQTVGSGNFNVTLDGTVLGGVPAYTFNWDTNNDGTYGDLSGQHAVWTVANAQGGEYPVGLEVTDNVGAKAYAQAVVVVNKAAVANEPQWLTPVGKPASGVVKNAAEGDFAFDSTRVHNGLLVITHGLEGDNPETRAWLQDMLERINTRLTTDRPGKVPNLIIYDWGKDSSPSSQTDPKAVAALDVLETVFSLTDALDTAGEEATAFVRRQFSKAAKSVLKNYVSDEIDKQLQITPQEQADIARVLSEMYYIRTIAEADGTMLASWLWLQARAGYIDLDQPIHLIGHSAGGFCMGECALWLSTAPLINGKRIIVDRVTMLDTPLPEPAHLITLPNPTVVEQIVSSVYGGLEFPDTQSLLPGTFYRYKALDGWSSRYAFGDTGHGLSHVWYARTIYPKVSDPDSSTLDSYGTDGFSLSPFLDGPVVPREPDAAAAVMPAANEGIVPAAADQPLEGFTTFGGASQSSGVWTLTEQANAGLVKSLTMPVGAKSLKFRFMFSTAGDGDYLHVRFGDNHDLYMGLDNVLSESGYMSADIPVEGLDGLTDNLIFTLVSRGSANAVVQITDLSLSVSDDADSDGLTNAQESTLGTNPLSGDTDHDGISDWEEVNTTLTNPLKADSDGDGMTDSQEIIAGTNGLDAKSVFRTNGTTVAANGNVTVIWSAKAGKTYQVQRSDTPGFINYTVVGDSISGVEPTTNFTDRSVPGGTPRMFYRVQVE